MFAWLQLMGFGWQLWNIYKLKVFQLGVLPPNHVRGRHWALLKTINIATIKVYNMLFGNQQQLKILLYDNLFHPSYIFSTCNQWEQWSCHQQVDLPRVQTSRNPQLYGYTSNTWNVNIYNPVLNGSDELLWKASDIDVQSKVHECPWEHRKKNLLKTYSRGLIKTILQSLSQHMSLSSTNLHFKVFL